MNSLVRNHPLAVISLGIGLGLNIGVIIGWHFGKGSNVLGSNKSSGNICGSNSGSGSDSTSTKEESSDTREKIYTGNCHCGAVSFTAKAPSHLVVWRCNCSICNMRKNWHFVVPQKSFQLCTGTINTHS